MNGVIAGVIASVLILVGAVTGIIASNSYMANQQNGAQTATGIQVNNAINTLAGN